MPNGLTFEIFSKILRIFYRSQDLNRKCKIENAKFQGNRFRTAVKIMRSWFNVTLGIGKELNKTFMMISN